MASLCYKKQFTIFASICVILYLTKKSYAQNDYVDFLRKANDRLTVDLLSALADRSEDKTNNLLFSPSSILTGIGMLFRGMDGETRENVRKIMGFPPKDNPKIFRDAFKKLTRNSSDPDDSPKYAANMITVNTDNKIKNSYATDVKNVFNGNPYHEKFSENPEKTRRNINAWVSKRTNKKIKELLPPDGIKAETLVVLVNVLYFKDNWRDEPFGENTDIDTFHLGGGQTVDTDFMEADEVNVGYKDLRDVEIVSIPFEHENFHFVIVAPKEGSDPETVLGKLQTDAGLVILDHIASPKATLDSVDVNLKMPVFKTGQGTNLADIMENVGLGEIMESSADYGKISETPVQVDAINHKAVIDVNTKGVEAAAATSISIVPKFGSFKAEKEVKIDRPFLYFIVENSKKIIHFAGMLRNPTLIGDDK